MSNLNEERTQEINALIAEMTLEEKVGLMLHESMGVPRLGIQPYNWWNECLHGVARNGPATIFPQTIALAATFDTELAQKEYGARAENFCVVLGPHIRACCYIVNQERAAWFSENFTPESFNALSMV